MLFAPSSAAITCPTCWVPFFQPLSTPVADSDWPFSLRHRSLALGGAYAYADPCADSSFSGNGNT